MAMEIAKQAVNKQLEIMQEQQKKAAEFVDKKVTSIVKLLTLHCKVF